MKIQISLLKHMEAKMKKLQIGVMGPAISEYPKNKVIKRKIENTARELGRLLASKKVTVFTGGMDGVMEATLRGAKEKNGLTIGVPGRKRGISNKFVDVEILTDIEIGSFLFAGLLSCDSLIFIPGGAGTLAELCIAYRNKKPIVIMKGFDKYYDSLINNYLDNSKLVKIYGASNPKEAVSLALKMTKNYLNRETRSK